MFVHEMLHMLITIGKGDLYMYWNKSLLGVSPFSDCELNWTQSVIYKILPFLVLSVGFYLIALLIGGNAGSFLKFIAMINLGMSFGDILLTPFYVQTSAKCGILWRWIVANKRINRSYHRNPSPAGNRRQELFINRAGKR